VHGRRFHALEEGRYVFPNDEEEKDRLDQVHQMVKCALGKLYSAPLEKPRRVLDIGTGTGIWAIEFGEEFPQAEVTGNDLSPIQPRWLPTNVQFEVDDVEKQWTFSRLFDFIHCRGMYGSIQDWPKLLRTCFQNTAPGGYCEFTDWDNHLTSPDESIPPESDFLEFNRKIAERLEAAGKTPHPGPSLEKWMSDAGYQIVGKPRKIALPFGRWPADKSLKEIGAWNFMQLDDGLPGFATWILSEDGWQREEIEIFCARVRAELMNKSMHSMVYLYNVVGRKPEDKQDH
jgi:SAM-dependent methyltransferase